MSHNNYKSKIITALLVSEQHIRGLAKQVGTNQTTSARKVAELHKDNIVDFRNEGKNKVVRIKKTLEAKHYVYMVEAQKVLDLLKHYPFLRRIIDQIQRNQKIRLAVLFGSYAKGSAHKESDIDIYIDTQARNVKDAVELIDSKIRVKIGMYDRESILIKEIEKNHVLIKGVEEYYKKNKFFE